MRLLLPAALLLPAPAAATELFAGAYVHGVETPLSLGGPSEDGAALSVGIRGARIGRTPIQPHALVSVSTAGETSFLAAGISARFGSRIYVRPGVGLAIHDGSDGDFQREDRIAFGSRILFAPEIAVGARIDERLSVEASWLHLSHGQVFGRQNPGLDNIGVRVNWRL